MSSFVPFHKHLSQLFVRIFLTWKRHSRQLRIIINDLNEKMRGYGITVRLGVSLFVLATLVTAGSMITSSAFVNQNTAGLHNATGFSIWMAESLIARQQGVVTNPVGVSQPLQAGITQKALAAVLDTYPKSQSELLFRDYIRRSTEVVAPYLSDALHDVRDWPLDRLSNGNAMFRNGSSAYDAPLSALAESVALNQRNDEEGLWYWEKYPEWSYLDGMYSFAPFSAMYAFSSRGCSGEDSDLDSNLEINYNTCDLRNDTMDDIYLQFTLLWQHCGNATTGLLYHGYDATKQATWAGRATGSSPVVWGRSLGWYAMALVDTIELLPAGPISEPWRGNLLVYYRALARGIMRAADAATGGWFQVVDQGARDGNYIESSASAMFSYALLKGARLGYVAEGDVGTARSIGRHAHRYLTETFVDIQVDGTLGWNGTVGVCSLNSTANYEVSVLNRVFNLLILLLVVWVAC